MHEYSFRWTASEYVRASHVITRHMRGQIPTVPMLFIAALILFIAALAASRSTTSPWAIFAVGALFLLWASYLYWGAPWFTARRLLRDDPCAKDDIRHIITPEGFSVRTGAIAVDVKWRHFVQVVETPEFLLFYLNKRTAYFTPKRAIPEADLPILRPLLVQWIGVRARVVQVPAVAA